MWNPCSDPKRRVRALAGLALLLAAGCGPTPDGPEIRDAWVRAVPPTSGVAAGYFTLVNHGEETFTLVGASSPSIPRVELHEMRPAGDTGAVRMAAIDRLRVAPGETVRFETGGRHLMLMDMARAPQEGERVTICLEREDAAPLCHDFPVRAGGHDPHHHH